MTRPVNSALSLYDRIVAAFVWVGAFCLACGVYFSITLLFRWLPPSEPVAVGLVPILRYSKLRDYLAAALFVLCVPLLTVWLQRLLARGAQRESSITGALLFTVPYCLSPVFYLTTGKVGWILALPFALSLLAPRLLRIGKTRTWLRAFFRSELRPYHALLFAEGIAWLLFRYLTTGRWLAHAPTLFLETLFVALFLSLFWFATLLISRMAELTFAASREDVFRRITVAALPIVLLPVLAVIWVPLPYPRVVMALTLMIAAIVALRLRRLPAPGAVWGLAAYALFPLLIYVFSYASTAQLSQWVDLFHRGETIGPASDYLRGRVPYRDVFPLHGMLEDGLLDAWLMEIFGRSLDVAVARQAVLASFLGPAIWFLGITVFRSIPLALLCVAIGSWTTAESHRTFLPVAAAALYWNALKRRSRMSAFWSGILAAVALFFSYETGLYTIAGAFAVAIGLFVVSLRVEWPGLSPGRAVAWFSAGLLGGGAPFVIWLGMQGVLDDFAMVSFVTIPNIIDSVWSLPFPELVSTFRRDVTLRNLAEFVLQEKFHLVISMLAIAIAAVYYIQRWLRRRTEMLDHALLVLTIFATIAQRTAFGRASFRHQYFAAFLIAPILILLAMAFVRRLRELWNQGDQGTRAFVVALVVIVLPLLGILFWIPDLVDARLNEVTRYYARMQHFTREPHAEEVYWRIQDVSAAIRESTRPTEPIFDFSNQPAFYFFANRPNATRFYQVPILSPIRFQEETIRALELRKPKVILRRSPELFDQFDGVTNDLRAQAVAAYIDDVYDFSRSVRGVELWKRDRNARPRRVSDYLALIQLPSEKELIGTAQAKLVFPAVGNPYGVGGSHWQSDLTMHNPFREPVQVRLRFVHGEGGVDRRVSLAPRQTILWPDVARTLFGLDGAIGTLWLEHRDGRAPVAIVKTADVAHHSRASLQMPLARRDAAVSGGDNAELAVIGIPAATEAGRRVNLGVVNIGTIPATFRFSARTRNGSVAGRPIESGVPEESLWIVNDIEQQMGVVLDQTMTVRLTAIAGTGVGFATIVEPNGDSEFLPAAPAQQQ